jgi:hypothetical protein
MTQKELEDVFAANAAFTETLSGMLNGLINSGFSREVAEQIILMTLKGKTNE